MKTYDDLGMSFPLFRGPVAHAEVDAAGTCDACHEFASIRFCETCYKCFRDGGIDHAINTELGMVRVEDALVGLTHGIPLGKPPVLQDYELVPHPIDPHFPNETWFHVRIDSEFLLELVRTPTYQTVQGECWQFCCKRPCVFLGSLPAGVLSVAADSIIDAIGTWFHSPQWVSIAGKEFGPLTYHVFKCSECNSFRYHEDMD